MEKNSEVSSSDIKMREDVQRFSSDMIDVHFIQDNLPDVKENSKYPAAINIKEKESTGGNTTFREIIMKFIVSIKC